MRRRKLAAASLLALGGCGYPTNPDGSVPANCALIEGLTLETPLPRYQRELLAVGQTRSFAARVGPAKLPCSRAGSFTLLKWHADIGGGEPNLRARLTACEACVLLYEGFRDPLPGRDLGVVGAARLDAGVQTVTFEVTGVKPGLGSLTLFACVDPDCVQAAHDQIFFDVSER